MECGLLRLALDKYFSSLPDPRTKTSNNKYEFKAVLAIAVCGFLCSCDNWVAVANFGKINKDWFSKFFDLPNGTPEHDTFSRIFAILDPLEFQKCFLAFSQELLCISDNEVIAIDGKTSRHSYKKNSTTILYI